MVPGRFRVVPGRFRVVPGGSGWFRQVPAGSGRFRVGSAFYIHPNCFVPLGSIDKKQNTAGQLLNKPLNKVIFDHLLIFY